MINITILRGTGREFRPTKNNQNVIIKATENKIMFMMI